MRKNEKGIALSISAIVMIAVGLVVMLVIIGYFVGGVRSTGEKMGTASEFSEEDIDMSGNLDVVGDVWRKALGKSCKSGADCKSGNCTNNTCS